VQKLVTNIRKKHKYHEAKAKKPSIKRKLSEVVHVVHDSDGEETNANEKKTKKKIALSRTQSASSVRKAPPTAAEAPPEKKKRGRPPRPQSTSTTSESIALAITDPEIQLLLDVGQHTNMHARERMCMLFVECGETNGCRRS